MAEEQKGDRLSPENGKKRAARGSTRAEKRERRAAQSLARFERAAEIFRLRGFSEKDCTVGLKNVTLRSLAAVLPLLALFVCLFVFLPARHFLTLPGAAAFFPSCILSVPVHEALHALVWACVSRFRGGISFGREGGFFYCACSRPLPRRKYLAGTLAPFLLLALAPAVVSFFTGRIMLFAFSVFNLISASADWYVFLRALSVRGVYLDHPTRCGFHAFTSNCNN